MLRIRMATLGIGANAAIYSLKVLAGVFVSDRLPFEPRWHGSPVPTCDAQKTFHLQRGPRIVCARHASQNPGRPCVPRQPARVRARAGGKDPPKPPAPTFVCVSVDDVSIALVSLPFQPNSRDALRFLQLHPPGRLTDPGSRFVLSTVYQLPFGAGQRWRSSSRLVNQVVGGWQVEGIFLLQSGEPLAIRGANNFGTANRPNSW